MLVSALMLIGCVSQSKVDDLEARVKSLEEKVATLQAPPPKADDKKAAEEKNPQEDAASSLMREAQIAINNHDYETAKSKLNELKTQYPDSKLAKTAERIITEVALIGTAAPALEADKWFQGKAPAGGATLIVFWETWSPGCQTELPRLQTLSEGWAKKGLTMVGLTKVTRDATDESAAAFLKEKGIKFPNAKEKDGSMSKAYAVTGLPAAALVKDGKILWRGNPSRINDEMLTKLLGG